jgi:hypothetical protein
VALQGLLSALASQYPAGNSTNCTPSGGLAAFIAQVAGASGESPTALVPSVYFGLPTNPRAQESLPPPPPGSLDSSGKSSSSSINWFPVIVGAAVGGGCICLLLLILVALLTRLRRNKQKTQSSAQPLDGGRTFASSGPQDLITSTNPMTARSRRASSAVPPARVAMGPLRSSLPRSHSQAFLAQAASARTSGAQPPNSPPFGAQATATVLPSHAAGMSHVNLGFAASRRAMLVGTHTPRAVPRCGRASCGPIKGVVP